MRSSLLILAGGLLLSGSAAVQAQAPPALDLAEHLARLPGRWQLTLLAGFKHDTVLRPLPGNRFRMEKAVCFSGEYELRDNRLILVKSNDPGYIGFAWELRGPEELVLVEQPPKAGGSYVGSKLQLKEAGVPEEAPVTARAPARAPPPAPAKRADIEVNPEPSAPPSRRSLYILLVAGAFMLFLLGGGLGIWLSRRPRLSEAAPRDSIAVECDGCGRTLKVRSAQAGKKVKCSQCGETVQVPKA
jgi:hypothetical protein